MTIDLDAIRTRLAAATPGPWVADGWEVNAAEASPAFPEWIAESLNDDMADNGSTNGTFIAHAWQDVTDLLAEVERLRSEYVPAVDWGGDRIGMRTHSGFDSVILVSRDAQTPVSFEPLYRRIPAIPSQREGGGEE